MTLPFWFYWQGIPTPDQSLIPQVPATVGFGTAFIFGWLVNRSATALDAITRGWFVHLVLGIVATGWLLHTMHATPDGAARPHQDAVRAGVRCRGVGLGTRPHRRRAALPVQLQRRAPLHRRCFVLDLSRAPAGGRGARRLGGPLAAALEREVSVHPGRELRGAVPELSLPGAADVHRQAAQRPQVSARDSRQPDPPLRPRRRLRRARAAATRWHSCAPSPRSTAPPPRWPASTSNFAPASCSRCSAPTARARPRRSTCGSDSSRRTPARSRCSAVRRWMSNVAADLA